ncbi:hypothetical protein ATANTOWER_008254 [Ataeniobius toweri]|uniref:Uncharacterized protein n=1 Tax=Ataeniobius toweri TaxID=208326 RepID=A0ABU7AZ40_9TELE|nr:hypothetical protein [Ataeniobius toweri]
MIRKQMHNHLWIMTERKLQKWLQWYFVDKYCHTKIYHCYSVLVRESIVHLNGTCKSMRHFKTNVFYPVGHKISIAVFNTYSLCQSKFFPIITFADKLSFISLSVWINLFFGEICFITFYNSGPIRNICTKKNVDVFNTYFTNCISKLLNVQLSAVGAIISQGDHFTTLYKQLSACRKISDKSEKTQKIAQRIKDNLQIPGNIKNSFPERQIMKVMHSEATMHVHCIRLQRWRKIILKLL